MNGIELVIVLAAYFAPSIIAWLRPHRNAVAITIVNTLLGWTLVGWVVALAMACWQSPQPAPQPRVRFDPYTGRPLDAESPAPPVGSAGRGGHRR